MRVAGGVVVNTVTSLICRSESHHATDVLSSAIDLTQFWLPNEDRGVCTYTVY